MTAGAKAWIKSLLGRVAYTTPWPKKFFADKYVITAFHRVNVATMGDGISCSPAAFRGICKWLARNFHVVPLEAQIEAMEMGKPLQRTASITFDDGYLDNYESAAPILKELGLPATFFVNTDFIGSEQVPAWDLARGTRTRWMSWDQVRQLRRDGFAVESHTSTHIDMGVVPVERARAELRDTIARLAELPGKTAGLFAYPFGGKANITTDMRSMLQDEGFRCCLSCHGGINAEGTSRYHLVRVPVNEEYRHPYQFGLELLRAPVAGPESRSL